MGKLFENITKNNKEKICNFLETLICTFPKNTNVFSKIKSTIDLAYIEYGSIKIIKYDYNGNSTIVDTLYEGDIFGNLIFPISNLSLFSSTFLAIIFKDSSQIDYSMCI